MREELLRIENLVTRFYTEYGVVQAVDGTNLYLKQGETLGIVGESGSGKTVTAMSIMGMIENPGKIENGRILLKGDNLLHKSEKEMREIRGGLIAMVFQDSLSSLNPTLTVGEQIGRVLRFHTTLTPHVIHKRVVELLEKVGIPEPTKRYGGYPHEMSGGEWDRRIAGFCSSHRNSSRRGRGRKNHSRRARGIR